MQLLNHSSDVPLHRQLRGILADLIVGGSYAPGQPFLTDKEVDQTFRVSRTTVREAIIELTYLTRQQGQGTLSCEPKNRSTLRNSRALAKI